MLIDIHTHIDHPIILKDLSKVIENAKKNKVDIILTNGVGKKSNRHIIELSKKYPIIKVALGVYPRDKLLKEQHEGDELIEEEYDFDSELEFIEKNLKQKKAVAIGEVGLDYSDEPDKEQQISDFSKLIRLANKYDVPLIVHTRKAEKETVELLEKEEAKKVVLHCFSGNKKLIEKASSLGYSFSIPTNVVRSEHFQLLIKNVPISQLFCETDSPYLSPYKEKNNEPSYIIESYKKIAEIKKLEQTEVENIIFMNYQKMFQ